MKKLFIIFLMLSILCTGITALEEVVDSRDVQGLHRSIGDGANNDYISGSFVASQTYDLTNLSVYLKDNGASVQNIRA